LFWQYTDVAELKGKGIRDAYYKFKAEHGDVECMRILSNYAKEHRIDPRMNPQTRRKEFESARHLIENFVCALTGPPAPADFSQTDGLSTSLGFDFAVLGAGNLAVNDGSLHFLYETPGAEGVSFSCLSATLPAPASC
jgi:hypothetical protein